MRLGKVVIGTTGLYQQIIALIIDRMHAAPSRGRLWAGRIIGYLCALILIFSAVLKFIQPTGFDEGLAHLGWNAGKIFWIGVLEIVVAVIYLVPRLSVIGAILITGYMGGAIATHVRVSDPFPLVQILIAILAWLSLWLRDSRLKPLMPITKRR
jgi:hypothetical protein